MRTCDDIRERLSLYLDNELQDDERASVEAHVQSCASCKGFVDKEIAFLNAIRGSARLHAASPELKVKVAGVVDGSV
jgi:anti-sigma factor (TIGR02949 family)